MKPIATIVAACTVPFLWTANAQQQEAEAPQDQAHEGIPASPHQEQALRDIESELFRRLDENGDSSISEQEAQAEAALAQRWSELDRNRDQALDETEFSEFEQSASASGQQDNQDTEGLQVAEGEVTEEGLPASPHQQEVTRSALVEQLDTDGNGTISREEAQADARLQSEWQELDRDQDGELDRIELSQLEE